MARLCFSKAFVESPAKATQWRAFVRHARLTEVPDGFADLPAAVVGFVGPILTAVATQQDFFLTWRHPGPWAAR